MYFNNINFFMHFNDMNGVIDFNNTGQKKKKIWNCVEAPNIFFS